MAASYTILGITRTVDLSPNGADGYQYEIAFETMPHKARGAVLVPVAAYTAQAAAPIIAEAAAELEKTFNL